jgi:hypothetical protein
MKQVAHIFRAMWDTHEKFEMRTRCLGCNGWAFAGAGRKFVWPFAVEDESEEVMPLGLFCDKCAELPLTELQEYIRARFGPKH